jgi:hypothetical protein
MNYLVFFSDIQGHNLEYCHHLYNVAFNITNVEFVFIVPCEYKKICARFDWPNASNIKFDFIDEKNVRFIKEASALKKSFLISKVFLFYIKKYRPTASFVSTLLEIVPALPFMMFNKTKISGIIFRIYLYDWKTSSFLRKLLDLTKMIFISKAFCVSHALILNDKIKQSIASRYFNQLFSTRKFEFIPDPYIPISSTKDENFRNKFNIKGNTLLFSHIGAMNYSKGTLDLLDAIDCLIQKQGISNVTFAFFGKVNEDIKEDFYRRLTEIEKKANIIVYDTFCEYHTIATLCIESNLLILPYKRCAQRRTEINMINSATTLLYFFYHMRMNNIKIIFSIFTFSYTSLVGYNKNMLKLRTPFCNCFYNIRYKLKIIPTANIITNYMNIDCSISIKQKRFIFSYIYFVNFHC